MQPGRIVSVLSAALALTLLAGCRVDATSSSFSTVMLYRLASELASGGLHASMINSVVLVDMPSPAMCEQSDKLLQPIMALPDEFNMAGYEPHGTYVSCALMFYPVLATKGGFVSDSSIAARSRSATHRYEVYRRGEGGVSVDLVLNLPRLREIRDKLTTIPAFPSETGTLPITFSFNLPNDTTEPARLCAPLTPDGDLQVRDVLITIPPGGSHTFTLSPLATAELLKSGRARLFSLVPDLALHPTLAAAGAMPSPDPCMTPR